MAVRWLIAAIAAAGTGVAGATILGQAGSGPQPWSDELSDNLLLAKSIPFALGLGVAVGMLPQGRAIGLWAFAIGLVLGVPTGSYEYLGGLLDVHPPFPLYVVYRIHYVGALVLLFSAAGIVTSVWRSDDRSFLVPKGQWRRSLRGVAAELPARLVRPFVGILGIDMRSAPPARGRYSFYELVVSFPWWGFSIALITITGVVKALRYLYPVPGEVLFWASTLHVAAMVMIGLKVLDQLRIVLEGDRRLAVGAVATLWAAGSLAVAYFFLWSAFGAQTAAKEGVLSQVALLVGGVGIAMLALLVIRQFVLRVTRRTAG